MKQSNGRKYFLSTIACAAAVCAAGAPAAEAKLGAQVAEVTDFTDVPSKHYAYDAIMHLSAKNIVSGYPDNTYRLNQPVTRAQAAKMIALAIGAKPSHAYRMDFTDVPEKHGAYDHIRALTEKGLFQNQKKFNPNAALTRGQMAKLLVIGYGIITDDNDFIRFDDVHKTHGAYKYIISIAELNITTTRPGGKFKPNDSVTRGQLAAFLYRTMQFDQNRAKGLIAYDEKKVGYVDQDKVLIKPDPTPKPPVPKPDPTPPVITPPADNPSLAAQVIINVNAKRKTSGMRQLQADPALNRMAAARAEDLAKLGELTHIAPSHGTVPEMFDKNNYYWEEYGENIGSGFDDAKEITEAWLQLPKNQENLMNPIFTHIGSGTAKDADGSIFWVSLYSKK